MASVFFPTDLTVASEVAFLHALRLSLGGALTLIHVHPHGGSGEFSAFPGVRETLSAWGVPDLLPAVRKVEVEGNHVAAALEADLRRHPADMVVLACHPREGVAAWLKPSVSQEFVRRTRAPALFVPEGKAGFVRPDGGLKLDTVLIPITHEPDPQFAVDAAHHLLEQIGAAPSLMVFVHAGKKLLDPLPALPAGARHETQAMVIDDQPVAAILAAAEDCRADLIVMVSAGHDGFLDALRGSTTEQVIRRAPCAVLVQPAPDYGTAPAV